MKILFTDVDGVLHPLTAGEQLDPYAPVSKCIGNPALFCYARMMADILVPHVDVGIVMHSTWRLFTPEEDLRAFLGLLARYFAGMTPRGARYDSICWMVQQNRMQDYRIIDDALGEFPDGLHELIVCDPERGIDDPAVLVQLQEWLHA